MVFFYRLAGVQLLVFFCSNIPVVFDNPSVYKCLNTLFLLSPHLCFIICFFCDSLVARKYSWMSLKTSTQNKCMFLQLAEGEGCDLVRLV